MNNLGLLMGLIPLIVFVIVESFAGLTWALLTTVVLAIMECAFSLYLFGRLDEVSAVSLLLVIVMAGMSYFNKSPTFLKFQPVVLGIFLSAVLLVTSFIDDPIMVAMFLKYGHLFPYPPGQSFEILSNNSTYMLLLNQVNMILGFMLLLHSAIVAWAAVKLSNWWWIAIRGIGFYLFLALSFVVAVLKVKLGFY